MPAVRCPAHGLLFDPAMATGCARCRIPPASPTRRGLLLAASAVTLGGAAVTLAEGLAGHAAADGPAAPPSDVVDLPYDGHRRGVLLEPARGAAPCPLVVLYDPGGDARGIVTRYAAAARARGWAAASTYDVADGTPDEADTISMTALVAAVRARLPIAPDRVYAGGFSGGACGAYRLAIVKPDVVRGAVVECGHMGPWREVGARASAASRFYLFTRLGDPNRLATRRLRDAMTARGCRVVEVERPGGHEPMLSGEIGEALDWLDAA